MWHCNPLHSSVFSTFAVSEDAIKEALCPFVICGLIHVLVLPSPLLPSQSQLGFTIDLEEWCMVFLSAQALCQQIASIKCLYLKLTSN